MILYDNSRTIIIEVVHLNQVSIQSLPLFDSGSFNNFCEIEASVYTDMIRIHLNVLRL